MEPLDPGYRVIVAGRKVSCPARRVSCSRGFSTLAARARAYVTGAGGLISGTATTILTGAGATVGSGQIQISIPTSPPEAIAEALKGVANLGKTVANKAAKWIRMNNTDGARVRYFYQTLTATPF